VSRYVVDQRPQAVVIEDLHVKGMVKNHCLARSVSDSGMGEIRRQIEYKAEWGGVEVVVAGRFFPSSKTCSACGVIRDTLLLSERMFVCPDCGNIMDRDLNAARNLAASHCQNGQQSACGVIV
jgi:putative transposase